MDILGSDHCPISLIIRPIASHRDTSEEDLAVRWRSIDWSIMEEELWKTQKEIAQAAHIVTTVEKQYKGHHQKKGLRKGFSSRSALARPRNFQWD